MSTDFGFNNQVVHKNESIELSASGFPPARHPMEPDLFARQVAMPSHDQADLESAHVGIVGCGGLGSWTALALARMGVRHLTLVDPDHFDRTNAPRQLLFSHDLGQPKATALARSLVPHMTNAGTLKAIPVAFGEVVDRLTDVRVLVVGVDNNGARLETARWSLERGIPAIFSMLSKDGLRTQVFLQRPGGPCLSCVLPNLDAESSAPCAAASMASCFLATAHIVQLTLSAISGTTAHPTWRETSLDGSTERIGFPNRRERCTGC